MLDDGIIGSVANVKYCVLVIFTLNSQFVPLNVPVYIVTQLQKLASLVFTSMYIVFSSNGNLVVKLELSSGTWNFHVATLHTSWTLYTLFNTCLHHVVLHVNAPLLSPNVRYDVSAPNVFVFATLVE
jgi:hypothetical protein